MSTQPQEQWSSKGLFILATAGAAIGLGNIWKFPYMLGQNGGSAFLFVYLLCVCAIGIPLMAAELVCGRYAKANPVTGLTNIASHFGLNPRFGLFGYWGAFGLIVTLSFYSVVSGWSLAFAYRAITGTFSQHASNSSELLSSFLASPVEMLLWHSLFMALTMWVVAQGVQNGLERATKFLMPALFALLLFLVAYAMYFGDASSALHFLFDFNANALTPQVILSAMGHAFFTLALGAGAIMTYGRYLSEDTKILNTVGTIALLDTLVSVLAGLAIFPMVFAHGLSPEAGPTLMFITLPTVFENIHYGGVLGFIFFSFLFISAWTSSINIAQPVVTILQERFNYSLRTACALTGLIIWTLGLVCILSFNVLKSVTIWQLSLFEIATQIPDKLILPVGGIVFAVFAGWIMSKDALMQHLPAKANKFFHLWYYLVRYVCPFAILCVLLSAWFM